MVFSSSFLDDIRQRVLLSAIIGPFVAWDRRKSQQSKGLFWACCPFHGEKTPSFQVKDNEGRYYCFSCKTSGDGFAFLMHKEGLSFFEAVERLATHAGLSMPAHDLHAQDKSRERDELLKVLELATTYFQKQLEDHCGLPARKYLASRGVSSSSIRNFRLGYARSDRSALLGYLLDKGVALQHILDAGLVISNAGDTVDRFHDRIMFPISNLQEKIIAFGGRALSSSVSAKYLNSPETNLFHKRTSLYNGPGIRMASREAGTIVVVEGYLDVIALHQAGLQYAVSPLGTALTQDQLTLLWRMSNEPVICFDGDKAGLQAAYRAIDTALPLLAPGKSLCFVTLQNGYDPDDLVRAEGSEGIKRVLDTALPLVDMLWEREFDSVKLSTPERKAAFVMRIRELMNQMKDASVRALYTREFHGRMQLAWTTERMRPHRVTSGRFRPFPHLSRLHNGLARDPLALGLAPAFPIREVILIMTAVNHLSVLYEQIETLSSLELHHQQLDRLRCLILDIASGGELQNSTELVEKLTDGDSGLKHLMERLGTIIGSARILFAMPGSDDREASRGFEHTLSLHRKLRVLVCELEAVTLAFAEDDSEENFDRLVNLQREIASAQGMEVMLEDGSDL